VFLALAMEIKSGTNIQTLGAWLKRVSRRQALKIVRSRTRRKRREDAVRRTELHLVDTDSPLDQAVVAGIVRDAIDQLPERYRMAVVLHYFGGMTLEMIAVELKISKQAVGTRLHRGRKMLAERLDRQGVKLENGDLVTALSVLVPATVVGAIVKSATAVQVPASIGKLPVTMTAMLRAMAVGAAQRPMRLAVLLVALAGAGGALAKAAGPGLKALRQISAGNAVRWIKRAFQSDVPTLKPAPIVPMSDAQDPLPKLPAPVWRPDIGGALPHGWDDPYHQLDAAPPLVLASNGPLAYLQTQFAIPHSASLGAPILQTPVFARQDFAAPSHDWASPQSLRLSSVAGDATVATHDAPAVKTPAAAKNVASADTPVVVASDETLDSDEIRIDSSHPAGVGAGGGGGGAGGAAIVNDGGHVNAGRMLVGYAGTGAYRQRGNAQLNTGQLLVGVQPQSQGEVSIDSGTVELSGVGPAQIGVQGSGKLNVGSSDAPGVIHAASGFAPNVVVRATPQARGVVKGWGVAGTGGALINNGQIIADGYGQPRSLDLSGFARVDNTIDNPPNGTNGWYAQNGGQLILPSIQVQPGTHAYTWGESPTDPTLDLVNSLRVTVHDQPAPAQVSISLNSVTIADPPVQETGDLSTIGRAFSVVSLYRFGGADQIGSTGLHFAVRYDSYALNARLAIFHAGNGEISAAPNLYAAVDGRWTVAEGSTYDMATNIVAGDFQGTVQYLAVGLPITFTLANDNNFRGSATSYDAAPAAIYTINPDVPEPGAIGLLGVTGVALLRRRRGRRFRSS
jgi:RNA polymerase sigma factor (sigma-70 family)